MNELRKIRLVGDNISLDILERIFKSGDMYIFSEIHCKQKLFFMKSKSFENLDEKELRKTGNELLKKINSICCFVKGNYTPVKIDNVYIGDCGYNSFEEHLTIRDDCYIIENGNKKDFDEDTILEIYSKINNDRLLNDIMALLFEKGTDWVNLYRILDSFGDKKLISCEWITKKDLRLLKHTANSPGAIGNEARHGSQDNIAPSKPMLLNMAQVLVKKIIWHYIESLDKEL